MFPPKRYLVSLLSVTLLFSLEVSAQNFWQLSTGPIAGRVGSLAGNSSGNMFAGTWGAYIFRSTNNGANWTQVSAGLTNQYVICLVINVNGDIFAATDPVGVFRSTNNGGSWTQVSASLTALALAVNSSGFVFAGTLGSGVLRSTDNGANWSQVNMGLSDLYVQSLASNSSGYIFAGTLSGGVFRSTNAGGSWTQVNNGLPIGFVQSLATSVGGQVFAGTIGGVYRSTNNGGSWTQANAGLTNTLVSPLVISSNGHVFGGADAWGYGVTSGVFRSTDSGGSWTQLNSGLTDTSVWSLSINLSGYLFAGTRLGRVFRSVNPITSGGLAAPNLLSPANGATNQPLSLMLDWSEVSGATSYRVQVATDAGFTSLVSDASGLTASQYTIGGLSGTTIYYWRVNATDGTLTSAWSDVWRFTTSIGLSPPTLLSPANGATIQVLNPTLDWSDITGATSYRLQVSTSVSFISTVVDVSVSASQHNVSGVLTNNTTYYWRVNATNGTTTSLWSDVWSFTIGALQNEFLILDARDSLIRNKEFKFYNIRKGLNGTFIEVFKGAATTDSDGKVRFNPAWFFPGDTVKVDKILHVETSKPRHTIKIDNGKFMDAIGNLSYDAYRNAQPQTIVVDHTTIMYMLSVSVEWDADAAFFQSLRDGVKYMSNYLYDVFDGQLYINSLEIHDQKENWNNADIWIHANNDFESYTDLLIDHVSKLPRIVYSNLRFDNRKLTYSLYPYEWKKRNTTGTLIYAPSRALAHEFGHHGIGFRDEYWTILHQRVFPNASGDNPYDFGFMDEPIERDIPENSEMSSALDYAVFERRITEQWRRWLGKSCWEGFQSKYENTYDGIFAPIRIPQIQPDAGPNNDFNNLQYDVGELLQYRPFDSDNRSFTLEIQCLRGNTGYSLDGVKVLLRKPTRSSAWKEIEQGYTDLYGRMYVLGTNINDHIVCTWENYSADVTVFPTDRLIIFLRPTNGNFRLVSFSSLRQNGSLELSLFANRQFINPPQLELVLPGDSLKHYTFALEQNTNRYFVNIPDSISSSGLFAVTAYDDSLKPFPISLAYSISDFSNTIHSSDGNGSLYLDSANHSLTKIAISTSSFPASQEGLEYVVERGGDIYSISGIPDVSSLSGTNLLSIRYSKSDIQNRSKSSLRIFYWDESQRKWKKIGGIVDTLRNEVTAQINSFGTYAAFTTSAISTDQKLDNNNVFFYPNPFNPDKGIGRFVFGVGKAGNVTVKIYDVSNTLARTLDGGGFSPGTSYEMSWDGRKGDGQFVANGVYFYVIASEGAERGVGKLAVLR